MSSLVHLRKVKQTHHFPCVSQAWGHCDVCTDLIHDHGFCCLLHAGVSLLPAPPPLVFQASWASASQTPRVQMAFTSVHACTHIYTFAHICIHMHRETHAHTHAYTHAHTSIYIYTHVFFTLVFPVLVWTPNCLLPLHLITWQSFYLGIFLFLCSLFFLCPCCPCPIKGQTSNLASPLTPQSHCCGSGIHHHPPGCPQ